MRYMSRIFAFCGLSIAGVSAYALAVNYDVRIQATVNPQGTCSSGIYVVDCNQVYNSNSNPLEGFAIGDFNQVSVNAEARDGPVKAYSSGTAQFGVVYGGDLVKAYVSSGGRSITTDCIPNDGGGATCYSANAAVLASTIQLSLREGIFAFIPAALDGFAVSARMTIPVSAFGNGSSWGEVFSRFYGLDGSDSEYLTFGNLNVNGGGYLVDEDIVLDIPIRSATSQLREVFLNFALDASFRSSTANGPGFLNAFNSIGLSITSSDGVTFRSESGDLDSLLAPTSVPEPNTMALAILSLAPLVLLAHRRRKVLR